MVKHIVAWNFKETADPQADGMKVKAALEGLQGKIDGLLDIKVILPPHLHDTSNRQVVLDSTFTDAAALAAYQAHPDHVAAAAVVAAVVADRVCVDYDVVM